MIGRQLTLGNDQRSPNHQQNRMNQNVQTKHSPPTFVGAISEAIVAYPFATNGSAIPLAGGTLGPPTASAICGMNPTEKFKVQPIAWVESAPFAVEVKLDFQAAGAQKTGKE